MMLLVAKVTEGFKFINETANMKIVWISLKNYVKKILTLIIKICIYTEYSIWK